jgi:hypothetical protein
MSAGMVGTGGETVNPFTSYLTTQPGGAASQQPSAASFSAGVLPDPQQSTMGQPQGMTPQQAYQNYSNAVFGGPGYQPNFGMPNVQNLALRYPDPTIQPSENPAETWAKSQGITYQGRPGEPGEGYYKNGQYTGSNNLEELGYNPPAMPTPILTQSVKGGPAVDTGGQALFGGLTPQQTYQNYADAVFGAQGIYQPNFGQPAPRVASPFSQIPIGPEYNTVLGPLTQPTDSNIVGQPSDSGIPAVLSTQPYFGGMTPGLINDVMPPIAQPAPGNNPYSGMSLDPNYVPTPADLMRAQAFSGMNEPGMSPAPTPAPVSQPAPAPALTGDALKQSLGLLTPAPAPVAKPAPAVQPRPNPFVRQVKSAVQPKPTAPARTPVKAPVKAPARAPARPAAKVSTQPRLTTRPTGRR